jgi:REP element-mobilizing transposase RayT
VWRGEGAARGRAIVRAEGQKARVDLLPGPRSPDHGHGLISILPHVTSRRWSQRLQGTRADHLRAALPHLAAARWGGALGGCGGTCAAGVARSLTRSARPR